MDLTRTARPTAARRFAEIVGTAHVRMGASAAGLAIDGLVPDVVVMPGSVDEVSRCLALAHSEGLAVAPMGRGTRLQLGGVPRRLDAVLSVERLDRILAHEPADLTVSVEAGVRLGVLGAATRIHRQCLPLDPARAAGSTIGGLVATAVAGPYRARYGTMRELLLGVTVVQADGTVVKGGGHVVKNATGYDMPRLYVGALGTLGVVVEAHLRLHPVPAEEATWVFGFSSAEAALDASSALRDAPLAPSRLALLDQVTLGRLGEASPPGAGLAIGVGGVPEAVRAQGSRIGEICVRGGGQLLGESGAEPEWWQQVSDAGWASEADGLTLRVGTRPTDLVRALRALEAAVARASRATLQATAEAANGVLHGVVRGPGVAEAAALCERLRESLVPLDGTCVVEQAPVAVKQRTDVWGDVGPAVAAMRRLKAELDPREILNPGRFVGGI